MMSEVWVNPLPFHMMSESFPTKIIVQSIPSRESADHVKALLSKYSPLSVEGPIPMDIKQYYKIIFELQTSDQAKDAIEEFNYYSILGEEIEIFPFFANVDESIEDTSCSVIVYNLDQTVELKRLHKVMNRFGFVLFCRFINADPSGESRTLVQFRNPDDSEKAIKGSRWINEDGGLIHASHVTPSASETAVYVKHIPRGMSKDDIRGLFENLDGFIDIQIRADGDVILQFESGEDADAAIAKLNRSGVIPNGRLSASPYVSKSQRQAISNEFDSSKTVFIRSIPIGSTQDDLKSALQAHVRINNLSWRDPTVTSRCATAIVELGSKDEVQKLIQVAAQGDIDGFSMIVVNPYYSPKQRKKFQAQISRN